MFFFISFHFLYFVFKQLNYFNLTDKFLFRFKNILKPLLPYKSSLDILI